MADQKITDLTADTSPSTDDLIITVNDPAGTPANRKVTIANLSTTLAAETKTLTNKTIDADDNTLSNIGTAELGDDITTAGKALLSAADAAAQRTALDVDQAGTDNSTDVTLAGSLDYITISGQEITRNAVDLSTDVTGNLPVTNLNSGTGASGSTFWAGDGTWKTPSGSGDVSKVGTPADGQIGVWTGDGTIEGDSALTFDTSSDTLTIAASGNLAFGAVNVLDDNAGTMTLSNIDALDATTVATIEAAIDTLANLTSIQGQSVTISGTTTLNGTNTGDVTLAGSLDYITISGQQITRNAIDLAADVTGNLPVTNLNGGTSASASTYWRGDGTWATPSASGSAFFDDDGSTPGTLPSASGADAIAIGDGAAAGGAAGYALGRKAQANTGAATLALGSNSSTGTGTTATGTNSIAIGTGNNSGANAASTGNGAIVIGGSASTIAGPAGSGAGAIVIGSKVGTGAGASPVTTSDAAIVIGSNTSTGAGPSAGQPASIAIGGTDDTGAGANASGSGAIAIGGSSSGSAGTVSSGSNTIAIGTSGSSSAGAAASGTLAIAVGGGGGSSAGPTASGTSAIALGGAAASSAAGPAASGTRAVALCAGSVADVQGMLARATGHISAVGDNQGVEYLLYRQTTNATPAELSSDGNAPGAGTCIAIPSGGTLIFDALIEGRSSADAIAKHVRGLIYNSGGTTALVSSVVEESFATAGATSGSWAISVTADNTNDRLAITVTGQSATTINWGAKVSGHYVKI